MYSYALLLILSALSLPIFAQERLVADFDGDGMRNTRPVVVGGPWELQWEARGDVFQVYLHDGNGELVAVAANQTGAGDGASYQPRGGRYYLQVNALGAWTVRVVPAE